MNAELETVWTGATWHRYDDRREPPSQYWRLPSGVDTSVKPTPAQDQILALIRENGALTRKMLHDLIPFRSYASISTSMDRLHARDLIEKSHKVKEGVRARAWAYRITAAEGE